MAWLLLVTAAKTVSRNEASCSIMIQTPSLTVHRSSPQDWSTDFALFTAGVKVNPNNVKLRSNLGMELKGAGRLEEAQHQYLVCSN